MAVLVLDRARALARDTVVVLGMVVAPHMVTVVLALEMDMVLVLVTAVVLDTVLVTAVVLDTVLAVVLVVATLVVVLEVVLAAVTLVVVVLGTVLAVVRAVVEWAQATGTAVDTPEAALDMAVGRA